MKVTVTAEWENPTLRGHRIQIAGYTAAVEQITAEGHTVFEYTVLQDHLRIVETGVRESLERAKWVAEQVIENDLLGVTGFRVIEVEVDDEGFNASLIGKTREEILAERHAIYAARYPNG